MEQPLSERAIFALIRQLIRSDAIDTDDVVAAADELTARGDDSAAFALKALIVESSAPRTSDWQADKRRARFRVIDNDGNPER